VMHFTPFFQLGVAFGDPWRSSDLLRTALLWTGRQ